ncbi:thioredoxin-like protein [Lentinula aciculospora]|uniref:Thioredoxin-like protein n=1 Tax=Lentinula aciculospora TaxID=153920 RepID=A0A9W9A8W1_9AGAR|nr:thioredoxin-like protein [Lentinula aciculospora]
MFSRFLSPAYRLFMTSASQSPTMKLVESTISENPVTVFSKTTCPFCSATKSLFSDKFPNVPVKILELDLLEDGPAIQSYLAQKTGQHTVPNVFVHSRHIGGNDSTQAAYQSGKLSSMLKI